MPVYLDFLQVAEKKLQLALCGSNLPTLLELVKAHNTCELQPRISVSFRHLQVVPLPRIPIFDTHDMYIWVVNFYNYEFSMLEKLEME